MPVNPRKMLDSMGALLVAVVSAYVAWTALTMGWLTMGQTTGSGLPLELTFYPMGAGALFMTAFALDIFRAHKKFSFPLVSHSVRNTSFINIKPVPRCPDLQSPLRRPLLAALVAALHCKCHANSVSHRNVTAAAFGRISDTYRASARRLPHSPRPACPAS